MKKLFFCCGLVLFLLTGCANESNSSLADKPNFFGTVEEVHEGAILVYVDEGEDERLSCEKISVPLETEAENSQSSFVIGDKVRVYYDGIIAESYPGQIHKPYAIERIRSLDSKP